MVDTFNLPAAAKRTTKRTVLTMRPVVMTQVIEDELYTIYRDEIINPWTAAIKKIGAAYEKPPEFIGDADGTAIQWLIDQTARDIDNRQLYQTPKLGRWVTRVGNYHTLKTIAAAKSATGVDISPFLRLGDIRGDLENSIRENVNLISNVNADTKKRVEQVIFDGIANRRNQKYVVRELAKAMGVTQRRARIIARDQTHKMNAVLSRLRNQQLGIDGYVWQTRMDDRVRHTHEVREGKKFLWSKPPVDGHPGYPVNCRCTAGAILIDDGEFDSGY